jgi:negative regulator of flagellin synthesis FlgM
MKIDPRVQLPGDIQSDSVKNSRKSGAQTGGTSQASTTRSVVGEDTVNISSTHGDVQTLKASLLNVPEIRIDRVNALQQKVSAGQYAPSSEKIADAIIADHLTRAAKA